MSIGGINGLLAYSASDEIQAVSRRRSVRITHAKRARADRVSPPSASLNLSTDLSSRISDVTSSPSGSGPGGVSVQHPSQAETRELERLKARDREVRAHEQAHKAAAGRYAQGGPDFSYTRGPDGRSYATEGSVSVDTSEIPDDPEATLAKMEQVRRAALAPSDPSAQDSRVAAEASQKASEARREIPKQKLEERSEQPRDTSEPSGKITQTPSIDDGSARRFARNYQLPRLGEENGRHLNVRA